MSDYGVILNGNLMWIFCDAFSKIYRLWIKPLSRILLLRFIVFRLIIGVNLIIFDFMVDYRTMEWYLWMKREAPTHLTFSP